MSFGENALAHLAIVFSAEYLRLFVQGLGWTFVLLLASLMLGGLFVVPLSLARLSAHRWLALPVWFFTYVIRGTPLLIQTYIIYYGIAQMDFVQDNAEVWPWTWFINSPLFCAILAFSINTCAYTVEIFAGAIRETTIGEIEAAQAAGFSRWGALRHLILPSAARRALPAYSNEVIFMLHGTTLASAVPGILEVFGVGNLIYKVHYIPFTAYTVVGLIYLLLTFILIFSFRRLELRYLRYLQPRH